MENIAGLGGEDDQMVLPPGFRFHPTDEELITHYLSKKVVDCNFSARAIGQVNLNNSEPWELPGMSSSKTDFPFLFFFSLFMFVHESDFVYVCSVCSLVRFCG